jgi:hypothetical protein
LFVAAFYFRFTPYYKYTPWEDHGVYKDSENLDIGKDFRGNFYSIDTRQIIFKKLYFEIGVLTFVYLLILLTLRKKAISFSKKAT